MAKKIFKGVGGALGIGKKKAGAAPVASDAAPTGPVTAPIAAGDARLNRRRKRTQTAPSLLSGIGTTDRMGG